MGGRRAMGLLTQFGQYDQKLRNTKIFFVRNDYDDKVFMGYTTKPLIKRFYLFKACCETMNKTRIHNYLNNVGLGNIHIELLEECNCYLIKEVTEHIVEHVTQLTKEGYEVQQEIINDKELIDFEQNYNEIYKLKCDYYKLNKPKEYYNTYPNRIVKSNEKYQANSEYIESQKEKVKCDVCNSTLQRRSMYEHKTSKKHLAALKIQAANNDVTTCISDSGITTDTEQNGMIEI